MISSKLILFFCFHLLLLDSSLGRETILQQGENKKLLMDAIDFGATYGGEVELLGSLWKQLLIQLVEAKRKVGLGKYQLARFSDSATTEEVGLAIKDAYADKFAELVAIRTQDIGTTPKYVDDLEILKDEIALTMIVKMEKIKEQFKEKNVRKKVKEAKENGLTDTDIKEILFADFFDSGGLSLIDAGDSKAQALLSSFREGLKSIIHETYFEKLGILKYGNVIGSCLPFGDCVGAGGDDDEDNNDAGGDGDVPEGNGGDRGGAVGGDGGDPPRRGGGDGDRPGGGEGGDPENDAEADEDDNEEEHICAIGDFERMIFPYRLNEHGERINRPPSFGAEEINQTTNLVNPHLESRRNRLAYFVYEIQRVPDEPDHQYGINPLFRYPGNEEISDEYGGIIYRRRLDYTQYVLRTIRTYQLDLLNLRRQLLRDYALAKQNLFYYGHLLGGNPTDPSLVPTSRPDELPEFSSVAINDYSTRYLMSRIRMIELTRIRRQVRRLVPTFDSEITRLETHRTDLHNSIILAERRRA